jgi:glucarate dehydratase
MKIASLEFTTISIPYRHRENSSQVNRDGVTDVIVKITTDDGLVGWGEACSGANVESVLEALKAFEPFVLGQNPFNRDSMCNNAFQKGIWNFRQGTFNFAWAGIDMALWDLCGKRCGQPVYNLLGGLRRERVNYFYYLPFGATEAELQAECRRGVEQGFTVFYIKTGVDIEQDVKALELIRNTIGPDRAIRIDSNQAWSVSEAVRNLALLDVYNIDYAEQPVPADPVSLMLELKSRISVPIAANEGLWRIADAWEVIKQRSCDVMCFSPYWVGSIAHFQHLSVAASYEGIKTCKHTHGEFGLAAVACHHVLLSLPHIVEGHQHTAGVMADDILKKTVSIDQQANWDAPEGAGLGVEIDEDKLARYSEQYQKVGQYLPYTADSIDNFD